MRKLLLLTMLTLLYVANPLAAQTWLSSPSSGDWNSAANWNPASVPNSLSSAATLGASSTTNLSLSADTAVGLLQFDPAAYSYSIATGSHSLEIGGNGILNQSSVGQTLIAQNGGKIILSGSADVSGGDFQVQSGGTFDISSLTSNGTVVGSIRSDLGGDIDLGSKNLALAGNGVTLQGDISDGGVGGGTGGSLSLYDGIVVLKGNNSFTGGVSILNGTLRVGSDNALGSGNVYNGSVLGAEPGVQHEIHVGGNYTQDLGAYLLIGLDDPGSGQYDHLVVDGTASLNGYLEIFPYNSYVPVVGDTFTLVSSQGLIGPGFPVISSQPFTNVRLLLWEQAKDLELLMIPLSFEGYALTHNEKAFSRVLDQFYDNSDVTPLIAKIIARPGSDFPEAYHLAAPEEYTSLYRIGFSDLETLEDDLLGRLSEIRFAKRVYGPGWSFSGPSFLDGSGKNEDHSWDGVLSASGSSVKVKGDSETAGYDLTNGNLTLAGVNHRLTPNLVGGGILGYNRASAGLENGGGVQVNGIRFGGYATWFSGDFHLDGLAVGGINYYDLKRLGLGEFLTTHSDGMEFAGSLGVGVDLRAGDLTFSPSASLRLANVELESMNEIGQDYSSGIPVQNEQSLVSEMGLRASWNMALGNVKASPLARFAWRHEYQLTRDSLTASLDGQVPTQYSVLGPKLGMDSLVFEAGLNLNWTERLFSYAEYRVEFNRTNLESQNLACGTSFGF